MLNLLKLEEIFFLLLLRIIVMSTKSYLFKFIFLFSFINRSATRSLWPLILRCNVYFLCFSLGIFFSLFPAQSEATLALKASIESLVEQADRIVYAEVYHVESMTQRGSKGEIYTQISIDVFDYWKGQGADELRIQTLGGTIGDLTLKVAGTPYFKKDQKVILFLKKDQYTDLNYLVALAQGVFYLDEIGHKWKEHSVIRLNPISSPNPYIYQDLTELSFYMPSLNTHKPTLIKADDLRPSIRTFKDLKQQIAQALLRPMTVDPRSMDSSSSSVLDLKSLRILPSSQPTPSR
jgi:hypothetical protein